MATELGKVSTLESMAASTGIIYDRSLAQEKMVGQAWLIGKSRLVTLASLVSNYAEAPWALVVKFPHADLTYSVKNVLLHPDFNKREARDYYLAQIHSSHLEMPQFDNDIATLTIDAEMTAITPERMAEINRALSVPFPIGPQDLSGVLKPGEAINIIQSALGTGRSGLLSMLDSRNLPFARMSIRGGKIVKAIYGELTNELAFCELMWRRPAGNFVFQASDQFTWPDLPDITMPTEQLASEAGRRVQEIPKILEMLGGPEVRFQRVNKQPDFGAMNPAQKWVAERLWSCLDGYLMLGRISERINSDTFTILKTLWEMRGAGMVTPSQQKAFSHSGQLGPQIMPATEMEVVAWDAVSSFYLDPISGGPMSEQGFFAGGGKVVNSKVLLHTIPIPNHVRGALVLKDGKLVGIHSGPFSPTNTQMKLPFQLHQMTYIGAIGDMGTKRLRSTSEFTPDESDLEQSTSIKMAASMRSKIGGQESLEETVPSERPPVLEDTGWEFLHKYTKNQIAAAAGISMVVALFMMILSIFGPRQGITVTPSTTPGTTSTGAPEQAPGDVGKAIALAAGFAGFKEKPTESYRWEDTSEITPGKESFGLVSDRQNARIIFVVSDTVPFEHLESFTSELPYLKYKHADVGDWIIKQGIQGKVKYLAGKYATDKNEPIGGLVGSFLSPTNPEKSILVVAYPVDPTKQFDFANTLAVIENMTADSSAPAASGTAASSGDAQPDAAAATPAEYRKSVQAAIQKHYKAPKPTDDENEDDSLVSVEFGIGAKGQITKINITRPGGEKYSQALQKAITASEPFGKPPAGENGYSVVATMDGTKLSLEEP